jgi:hypothetical protein
MKRQRDLASQRRLFRDEDFAHRRILLFEQRSQRRK